MKIVYQGDLHLRSSVPSARTQEYFKDQLEHLWQLVAFANAYHAPLILGGDIFDAPSVSYTVFNQTVKPFGAVNRGVHACFGPHDIYHHASKTLEDTAYAALINSGVMQHYSQGKKYHRGQVTISFVSWQEGPPKPDKDRSNVLVGHIPVYKDNVPFFMEGKAFTQDTVKRKYPGFGLYLCGDIHIPFVKGGVVVSGSMMRMAVNQMEDKPRAYLIDIETGLIEPKFFDEKPDMFVPQTLENTPDLDVSELVAALRASDREKISYKQDCYDLAAENQPAKEVIEEIFDEFDN